MIDEPPNFIAFLSVILENLIIFSNSTGLNFLTLFVGKICDLCNVEFDKVVINTDERLGKDQSYLLDSSHVRDNLNWKDEISLFHLNDKELKSSLEMTFLYLSSLSFIVNYKNITFQYWYFLSMIKFQTKMNIRVNI